MPTITNPGVIRALVTAFLLYDRNQSLAGLEVGYTKGYVYNGDYSKLWEREDVLAEIRRQEIELLEKTGLTKEHFAYDLEQAKRLGMKISQPSAAVSAIATNIRLHGLDQVGAVAAGLTINVTTDRKCVKSKEIDKFEAEERKDFPEHYKEIKDE